VTDSRIPLIVVITLAVGVVAGLGSMAYMAMTQTAIPDQFDRLVTFLAGGLTGILATTRGGETQAVEVVNESSSPVPTETVDGAAGRL
jgi:hypothetical protein